MFWKKEKCEDTVSLQEVIVGVDVDVGKDIVKCEECKCLLCKSDAYKVEKDVTALFYNDVHYHYYCVSHKKPYSNMTCIQGDKNRYFANLEVNEDGTLIEVKRKLGRPRLNK